MTTNVSKRQEASPGQPMPAARTLSGIPLFLAALALLLWVAFAIAMLISAKTTNEVFWTRLAFVFASVEAVAFGAAGAMWGVNVQKDRAEKAEKVAAANVEDAAKGRALAATTIADAADIVDEDRSSRLERLGGSPQEAARTDVLERHARIARSLFPDI